MPSSAMFTTPERSEMIPPSAAKISGVAKVRGPDAITADQVNTSRTFAAVWLVIASASGDPPDQADPDRQAAEPAMLGVPERDPRRRLDGALRSRPARSTMAPALRTRIGGSVPGSGRSLRQYRAAAMPTRLMVRLVAASFGVGAGAGAGVVAVVTVISPGSGLSASAASSAGSSQRQSRSPFLERGSAPGTAACPSRACAAARAA